MDLSELSWWRLLRSWGSSYGCAETAAIAGHGCTVRTMASTGRSWNGPNERFESSDRNSDPRKASLVMTGVREQAGRGRPRGCREGGEGGKADMLEWRRD